METTIVKLFEYAAYATLIGIGIYLGAKLASKEIRKALGNLHINIISNIYKCDDAKVVKKMIEEEVDNLINKLNNK